ncbi:leucine-rich repeat receptor-like protein kinase PXC1 [Magnolia sinica]|uniref:leucine-rich repeat receptor-like protein kinase PXC1 n=1 Tax=Magnolia sinica TaxID=86752 RepID=UPI002657FA8E|nr:leucine-rich repeat receptor-like protein kinase PXC1 [Magnolia sinica]
MKPMPLFFPFFFFFFFSFILLLLSPSHSLQQQLLQRNTNADTDSQALTLFRTQTDAHGVLHSNWTTSTHPCTAHWRGVLCSPDGSGRIIALYLPSLDLRGPLDALASLDQLRVLDLHSNRLNASLHPISSLPNLKLLYLSHNDLSGHIPDTFSLLRRLLRLDLSDNNLSGPVPAALSNLTRLVTLRLQNNALSGQLPNLSSLLPGLKEFNVSDNELYGKVPDGLRNKFGEGSFAGNAGLCGSSPFPVCSFTNSLPSVGPSTSGQTNVVPSNPSSKPGSAMSVRRGEGEKRKGLSTTAIVGIVVGDAVVLLVITSFLVAYYCGRYSGDGGKTETGSGGDDYDVKKRSSSYSSSEKKESDDTGAAEHRSKLVFFDRRKQFELEDLLKASAEMLGKGSLGTVYRAILEDGCMVAVKRLKDTNPCARKEFEQYMDVIGKLRHPNIVRLRAYYYAKEEKLLVYDYLPNGSLYSLLHGNRGPGRTPLDWTTRISLVLGAARGLARIHEEYSATKIPHGNIKSSNVLLDKNGIACIADFGLALLLNPVHFTARLGGYRAPEQAENKRLSQKADVYGFGVLLLEVLTGKAPSQYPTRPHQQHDEAGIDLPKWVRSTVREEWTAEIFDAELLRYKNIEEELVAMLQVALACVVPQAEERPTMLQVVKMIEEIRVEQSPLGEDLDESRNSLSPSLATTEDARLSY